MSEREYDVPAARKAISLIELLCESIKPLGISEISQRLDLNKNMVFRLVRTLTELGWIVADGEESQKYRMTLLPFQHASKPVNRMSVRLAAPGSRCASCGKPRSRAVIWCILDRRRSLCVEHFDATGALRIHGSVGGRYYLNATAPGKIMLAYDQTDLLQQLTKADLPPVDAQHDCREGPPARASGRSGQAGLCRRRPGECRGRDLLCGSRDELRQSNGRGLGLVHADL